jgi:hypothetical protein
MTTLLFKPATKEILIHSNCPVGSGYRYAIGTNTKFALSNYNDPVLSADGDVELFITDLEARHKAVLRRWGISNVVPTVRTYELMCDDGRTARITQTTTPKSYNQNHIWWQVALE